MAGLIGTALGWDKNAPGLYSAFDQNRNAIGTLGQSVVGQDTPQGVFGALAGGALYGAKVDREEAVKRQALEKQKNAVSATVSFLQNNNPQLAALVEAGAIEPGAAYQMHVQQSQGAEPTANMRDWQYAQANPGYADFINPRSASAGDAYTLNPGDVRYGPDNKVVATGPAKPTGNLSPTAQKELFEAEDAATAGQYVISALDEATRLSPTAFEGPGADLRGAGLAVFGNKEAQDTQRLQNVTTELALTQLRTVFGASPTEGERQILLDLQGSVGQSKAVRESIYKRAKEAALRRIDDNKRKAAALRSGEFFQEGYSGTPIQPNGGNTTAGGLSWSIEP